MNTTQRHWLQISGPDESWEIPLQTGSLTIGRLPDNDIRLEGEGVSRRHASITHTEDICYVVDEISTNGTKVNGRPLEAGTHYLLANGDTIEIGPYELTYVHTLEEPETAPLIGLLEQGVLEIDQKKEQIAAEKASSLPSAPSGQPPEYLHSGHGDGNGHIPPGCTLTSQRLLRFLPRIYDTPFMSRFLALFESVLLPVEWTIGNLDTYLDPRTTPVEFLSWLANWSAITFDETWTEPARRQLLVAAHDIYARRGTAWALSRVLEIYTGQQPEIQDGPDQEAFTFTVYFSKPVPSAQQQLLPALIAAHKPVYTDCRLSFAEDA